MDSHEGITDSDGRRVFHVKESKGNRDDSDEKIRDSQGSDVPVTGVASQSFEFDKRGDRSTISDNDSDR